MSRYLVYKSVGTGEDPVMVSYVISEEVPCSAGALALMKRTELGRSNNLEELAKKVGVSVCSDPRNVITTIPAGSVEVGGGTLDLFITPEELVGFRNKCRKYHGEFVQEALRHLNPS